MSSTIAKFIGYRRHQGIYCPKNSHNNKLLITTKQQILTIIIHVAIILMIITIHGVIHPLKVSGYHCTVFSMPSSNRRDGSHPSSLYSLELSIASRKSWPARPVKYVIKSRFSTSALTSRRSTVLMISIFF